MQRCSFSPRIHVFKTRPFTAQLHYAVHTSKRLWSDVPCEDGLTFENPRDLIGLEAALRMSVKAAGDARSTDD